MSAQGSKQEEEHEFRYFGAVNLYLHREAVGVVDVWRCTKCKAKGIELRAQGLSNLSAEAGFPILDGPDSRFVVFVCNAEEQPKFDVIRVHPGDTVEHDCVEKKSPIVVAPDYAIKDKEDKYHKLECIDNHINDEINLI